MALWYSSEVEVANCRCENKPNSKREDDPSPVVPHNALYDPETTDDVCRPSALEEQCPIESEAESTESSTRPFTQGIVRLFHLVSRMVGEISL